MFSYYIQNVVCMYIYIYISKEFETLRSIVNTQLMENSINIQDPNKTCSHILCFKNFLEVITYFHATIFPGQIKQSRSAQEIYQFTHGAQITGETP